MNRRQQPRAPPAEVKQVPAEDTIQAVQTSTHGAPTLILPPPASPTSEDDRPTQRRRTRGVAGSQLRAAEQRVQKQMEDDDAKRAIGKISELDKSSANNPDLYESESGDDGAQDNRRRLHRVALDVLSQALRGSDDTEDDAMFATFLEYYAWRLGMLPTEPAVPLARTYANAVPPQKPTAETGGSAAALSAPAAPTERNVREGTFSRASPVNSAR